MVELACCRTCVVPLVPVGPIVDALWTSGAGCGLAGRVDANHNAARRCRRWAGRGCFIRMSSPADTSSSGLIRMANPTAPGRLLHQDVKPDLKFSIVVYKRTH
jgi:hypothetical protein